MVKRRSKSAAPTASRSRVAAKKAWTRRQVLYIALALFLSAFLVRFIYLNQLQSIPSFAEPQMDERYHLEIANQINSEAGLSDEPFFRAPLYLYFFAGIFQITGSSFYWTRFVQIILGSLLPVLILLLGLRLFSRSVTLASAAIAVIYPTFLYYDNSLLITSLMVLLTTLLCWQLYRTEGKPTTVNFLLSGLLLGLAGLTRPNILLFGPALLIWVWFVLRPKLGLKRALMNYLLIGGVCILTILPVTIRNYVVADDFVPIAWQGGLNFFLGNNREATGWSATVSFIDPGWKGGYDEAIAIAERESRRELRKSEVSDYWYGRAFAEISADPLNFVGLLFKKLRLFFNGEEIPNNSNLYLTRDFVPILRPLMFNSPLYFPFGLIAPLAITGLAISLSQWRRYLLIYLLLGSYLLTLLLFFVCARFRQPLIPLMLPFTAFTVERFIHYFRKPDFKRLGYVGVALLILIVESNHSIIGSEQGSLESLDHYSLGTMYLDRGDLAQAEEHLLKAVELDPDFANSYINLGLIARRNGDFQSALKYYQSAWEVDSTAWRAYTNAAAILKRINQLDRAIALYERARTVAPHSDFIHHYLAQAYLDAGRIDDAKIEIQEAMRINPDDDGIRQTERRIREAAGD